MKRVFLKTITIVLTLATVLGMLGGCGAKAEPSADINVMVDAAVKAALEAAVVPTNVTIAADGQQITIEDAADVAIQQLLDQANITLNEGDYLSIEPYQTLSGNITIQVVRRYDVTVVLVDETEVSYTTVFFEAATVADAIEAVGIEMTDSHTADLALDAAIEDNMVITITVEPEETIPEETVPEKTASSSSSSSSSKPKPTEPKPTQPSKTVVSVQVYEDCDGSGHGVKVITYSDGTQEEVPF